MTSFARAWNVVQAEIGQELGLDGYPERLCVFLRERLHSVRHWQELVASPQRAKHAIECSWFHGMPPQACQVVRGKALPDGGRGLQVHDRDVVTVIPEICNYRGNNRQASGCRSKVVDDGNSAHIVVRFLMRLMRGSPSGPATARNRITQPASAPFPV